MAEMTITKAGIIIIALMSMCANETCPPQEKNTAVVLPYERISGGDTTIYIATIDIQNTLARNYNLGSAQDNPAATCKQIAGLRPSFDSGYYWIQGVSGAVEVYCEMGTNNTFGESGGSMRIANVDMRNSHSQCPPPGLVYDVIEGRRLCRKPAPGCFSTTFSTQGVRYNNVCGKVIGYQYHSVNGFGPSLYVSELIDGTYVDGVSITHGSPRQHIWTYAAAKDESVDVLISGEFTSCPCIHSTFLGVIPSFVGEDYYCETGSRTRPQQRYYFDDPLWDGKGCGPGNTCCNRGGPWFCKQLPQPTQDDIEMRVCTNGETDFEDVVLEQIELYVH